MKRNSESKQAQGSPTEETANAKTRRYLSKVKSLSLRRKCNA
jgi:hypothetical protein